MAQARPQIRSDSGTLPAMATDRALAVACAVLLLLVAAAIARGIDRWGEVPPLIWAHLLGVVAALALAPVLLWRQKGSPAHRQLGQLWAALMLASAIISLFFNAGSGRPGSLGVFTGDVSPIHLISLFVLILVPRAVIHARQHRVTQHRRAIRGLVIGALLTAGIFTFPFGRLMGVWLGA